MLRKRPHLFEVKKALSTQGIFCSKIKHDLYDAVSVADSVTDHSNLNTDPE